MESSALNFRNSSFSISLETFSCSTSACFRVMFGGILGDIKSELKVFIKYFVLFRFGTREVENKSLSSKRGAQVPFI